MCNTNSTILSFWVFYHFIPFLNLQFSGIKDILIFFCATITTIYLQNFLIFSN